MAASPLARPQRSMDLLSPPSDAAGNTITARVGLRDQYPHSAFSDAAVRHASSFAVRPSDVFLTTAPKTGTTWLQQIFHQLRCATLCDVGREKGHMAFDDIYQVVPWAQMSDDLGISLDAEQWAPLRPRAMSTPTPPPQLSPQLPPRIFKSHQRIAAINRGAKVVCVVRSPAATLLSWYNFLCAMRVPKVLAYPSVNEFVRDSEYCVDGMRFGATLWEYFVEFFTCATLPNVLCLVYEDLHADLASHLPHLAHFAGLPRCDAACTALVAERCSKMYMARHASKFDGSWAFERLKAVGRTREIESSRPAARVSSLPGTPGSPAARKKLLTATEAGEAGGAASGAAEKASSPPSTPSTPRSLLRRAFYLEEEEGVGHTASSVEETFNADALAFIDEQWAVNVAPVTGCATFSEMVALLRVRLAAQRSAVQL